MSNPKIIGYGDNLTIDNVRLGDLSPSDHENIEKEKGGQNYKPLEDVVVSHVKDSSTLICRKPSGNEVDAYVDVAIDVDVAIAIAITVAIAIITLALAFANASSIAIATILVQKYC